MNTLKTKKGNIYFPLKLCAIILMVFCLEGCPEPEYPLVIENNSDSSIYYYYYYLAEKGAVVYPDTTLLLISRTGLRSSSSKKISVSTIPHEPLQYWVLDLPKDTFSIFIFSKDTVDLYPWEVVQSDYKIVQRYDLSAENLTQLSNENGVPIIPYPPTEKMRDMKMYPPYGQ